jgi:hypothetical protein
MVALQWYTKVIYIIETTHFIEYSILWRQNMAHVTVEDSLLREAREAGGHRTMKAALRAALVEYISRRKRQQDTSRYETIDYYTEKSNRNLRDVGCKY